MKVDAGKALGWRLLVSLCAQKRSFLPGLFFAAGSVHTLCILSRPPGRQRCFKFHMVTLSSYMMLDCEKKQRFRATKSKEKECIFSKSAKKEGSNNGMIGENIPNEAHFPNSMELGQGS